MLNRVLLPVPRSVSILSVETVRPDIAEATVKLTPAAQKFVLHWGEMGQAWGINRTMAQVHALLFSSPESLDAGEISDPALATPDTLGAVRSEELRNACSAIGIEPPMLFDYPDGGLNRLGPQVLRDDVIRLIRSLKPRVLVTFDPRGGYGHA